MYNKTNFTSGKKKCLYKPPKTSYFFCYSYLKFQFRWACIFEFIVHLYNMQQQNIVIRIREAAGNNNDDV